MKPELSQINAYEIREEKRLDDIHSDGILLVHKKSGARICVMSNEDVNKVFYIAFRTPPKDSTGVPHIIEHTVLCGSKKFPVKDPFIELVKGSLNTFLNAMTYPDKTIYPVASCNDKDFQNLMDVYLDSVFSPNIYKEQNIFRQEGWHYELNLSLIHIFSCLPSLLSPDKNPDQNHSRQPVLPQYFRKSTQHLKNH